VPADEATRLDSHERLATRAPALEAERECEAETCSLLRPTPKEPGKHLRSHAETRALAPRLESTRARAVARRRGVDRTCVRALEKPRTSQTQFRIASDVDVTSLDPQSGCGRCLRSVTRPLTSRPPLEARTLIKCVGALASRANQLRRRTSAQPLTSALGKRRIYSEQPGDD
jgi:hypothetical protein